MKKMLLMGLTIMMVVVLAACGSNNKAGSETGNSAAGGSGQISLSIWHNFSGDDQRAKTMRGLIEQYQSAHPEVKLDVQAIPADGYKQRLKTVAAANELPDVFLTNPGSMIAEFYNGDLIQPIDDLLSAHQGEWSDQFLPGAFDALSFDGKVYGAPINLSPSTILYYNSALFEKYNVKVPETWDELMTAVQAFKDNNIIPIVMGNKANWVANSTVMSVLGDRVTGSDWYLNAVKGEGASFTDPEFVQALTYFKQLADAGAFQDGANSIDNAQAEQLFSQEQAAMTLGGNWTLTDLASTASEDFLNKVEVTTFPSVPDGKGESNAVTASTGTGFALNKKVEGAARDAALDLIYTISGPDAQKAIAESNILVNYKVDMDTAKATPLFTKTYELISSVPFAPVYDAYMSSAGTEALNNGLQELMLGGDPAAVAKKVQEAQGN
ncbi:ABC transporter substrate-binding protein [Paenibacillus yonginensis]|uniref:ABC transporter substrate-binding protein n=1 Tax=Paenibacillus yonginensis TaxID=1462996 RepID=A0A1B1MZV4_9BACL|nr:extracellular solute-binding protein [Paenibacillus yonginensis]ANS74699.1 ABC transporter substrate-binding protein [Paenibacillus yonginensis]